MLKLPNLFGISAFQIGSRLTPTAKLLTYLNLVELDDSLERLVDTRGLGKSTNGHFQGAEGICLFLVFENVRSVLKLRCCEVHTAVLLPGNCARARSSPFIRDKLKKLEFVWARSK
jgi:hypothetical protein